MTTCLVHPGRAAVGGCARCGRPLCADCARPGPSGPVCGPCQRRAPGDVVEPFSAPAAASGGPPPASPPTGVAGRRRRRPQGAVRRLPFGPGQLGATPLSPTVVGLVAVNTVIYVISRVNPNRAYARFAMVPDLVHQGQWYRLVTAAFLHVSTEHLLFNMVTLLIIGSPVAVLTGRARFVVIYLVAGIGGSVCSYLVSKPDIEGIGASGAIFGLFGAYAVLAWRRGFDVRTVGVLIGIELALSFVEPGIDWRAHVGGLVTGAAFTAALAIRDRPRRPATTVREVTVTIVTLAMLSLLVLLPPGHVNL